MIKFYTFFLYIISFALLSASPAPHLFIIRQGKVDFSSNAPLELIKASSSRLSGVIDTEKRTFAFKIPVSSFEGFNSALQREHFNENYMESKKYAEATFAGKIIETIDFNTDGEYTVRAKGKLNIHGVEQERIIKSKLKIGNGKIHVQTQFPVPLSDHNITIPKIVSQKIATEIEVLVNAEFERKK